MMEVWQRLRWLDVEGGRIDLNTGMTDKDVLGNCCIFTFSPPPPHLFIFTINASVLNIKFFSQKQRYGSVFIWCGSGSSILGWKMIRTNPDPGFWGPKIKKNYRGKKLNIFGIKYFCGSFLPSWIRIQIRNPDPDTGPPARLNPDPKHCKRNHIYLFLRVTRSAWSLHDLFFISWRWLCGSRCDWEKYRFLDLCSVWQGKTVRYFLNI